MQNDFCEKSRESKSHENQLNDDVVENVVEEQAQDRTLSCFRFESLAFLEFTSKFEMDLKR